MKYLLILISSLIVSCQLAAQQSTHEQVAAKIAMKMKDSLQLSQQVYDRIYAVNLQLHQQKMNMRSAHVNRPDSIQIKVQRIENTRDSLYRTAIGDDAKWLRYKSKKATLINNN